MIVYKRTDWAQAIWHFHTGSNARDLLNRLFIVAIYVTVVTVVEIRYLDLRLKDTPASFLSALGVLLSLLLLFRTNTAYDRFYEGRIAWGTLVNNCRNLAILYNGILPEEDQRNRQFFAKIISNFPFALKNRLRDSHSMDDLDETDEGENSELVHWEHLPSGVSNQLRVRTEQLYREGRITDAQHINLNAPLQALMDVCGVCERIKSTPIPFSYSLFIKVFIILYLMVIPFTLIDAYGYLTIPASVLMAYILVGLEIIGEEIEEPFGVDRNDLPLNQLSQMIRVSIHEIMQIYLPHDEKTGAKVNFVIVT